jgi:hypothetical protein
MRSQMNVQRKLMLLAVGVAGAVGILVTQEACGGPPPFDTNQKLQDIIKDCRNGELGNIAPKAGGGNALCSGLVCPMTTVMDLPKASCSRTFKFKTKVTIGSNVIDGEIKATATLNVLENKQCQHNHQCTGMHGTCAATYVNWFSVLDADVSASFSFQLGSTPASVDASGEVGGYNHMWYYHDDKMHPNPLNCT